jgi:hypothetical protein
MLATRGVALGLRAGAKFVGYDRKNVETPVSD